MRENNVNVLEVDPDRNNPYSEIERVEILALMDQAPAGLRPMVQDCFNAGVLRITNRDISAELLGLSSTSAKMRAHVVNLLGNLAHSRFKPQLVAAMDDEAGEVRAAATCYIKDFDDDGTKSILIHALEGDDESDVRQHALYGLAQQFSGTDIEEALLTAMADEDEFVSGAASSLLERILDGNSPGEEHDPMSSDEIRHYFRSMMPNEYRGVG